MCRCVCVYVCISMREKKMRGNLLAQLAGLSKPRAAANVHPLVLGNSFIYFACVCMYVCVCAVCMSEGSGTGVALLIRAVRYATPAGTSHRLCSAYRLRIECKKNRAPGKGQGQNESLLSIGPKKIERTKIVNRSIMDSFA